MIVGAISGLVYEQIVKIKDKNYSHYLKYNKQKKEYDAWWIRNQSLYWQRLSGRRFEEEVGYLYSQAGFKVRLTPHSDDGGIDLVLEKDHIKTIVQCKAHNKPIGPAIVRELYGTLINSGADKAILATLYGVTSGARSFISGKPITVIAIDDIIRMRKLLDDKSNHKPNEM
jgi:HJR/Mrr/RecB family endonuclease